MPTTTPSLEGLSQIIAGVYHINLTSREPRNDSGEYTSGT